MALITQNQLDIFWAANFPSQNSPLYPSPISINFSQHYLLVFFFDNLCSEYRIHSILEDNRELEVFVQLKTDFSQASKIDELMGRSNTCRSSSKSLEIIILDFNANIGEKNLLFNYSQEIGEFLNPGFYWPIYFTTGISLVLILGYYQYQLIKIIRRSVICRSIDQSTDP